MFESVQSIYQPRFQHENDAFEEVIFEAKLKL
jgi:hypothetical protein